MPPRNFTCYLPLEQELLVSKNISSVIDCSDNDIFSSQQTVNIIDSPDTRHVSDKEVFCTDKVHQNYVHVEEICATCRCKIRGYQPEVSCIQFSSARISRLLVSGAPLQVHCHS